MISKGLKLGTAALNIKTDWEEFERMLLLYSKMGGKVIDTAMNYPINGDPRAFRATLDFLICRDLMGSALQVKLGAATNSGTSSNILTGSYLKFQRNWIINRSINPIKGFGIHWDDRDRESEVLDTIYFILDTLELGFEVTLSGLKYPELYAKHLRNEKINFQLRIEDSESRSKRGTTPIIRRLFPLADIEYYGLFGGLTRRKQMFETECLLEELKSEPEYKYNLVIGPRNCEQLLFYKSLMAQN